MMFSCYVLSTNSHVSLWIMALYSVTIVPFILVIQSTINQFWCHHFCHYDKEKIFQFSFYICPSTISTLSDESSTICHRMCRWCGVNHVLSHVSGSPLPIDLGMTQDPYLVYLIWVSNHQFLCPLQTYLFSQLGHCIFKQLSHCIYIQAIRSLTISSSSSNSENTKGLYMFRLWHNDTVRQSSDIVSLHVFIVVH